MTNEEIKKMAEYTEMPEEMKEYLEQPGFSMILNGKQVSGKLTKTDFDYFYQFKDKMTVEIAKQIEEKLIGKIVSEIPIVAEWVSD